MAAAAAGYWGPPTATIDWCEDNYVVTPYIAEIANSLSSFLLVAAGLLPIALHRGIWASLEPRFFLACMGVAVVGAGSVAFHGTLLFRHQMLDEVPMLWAVVAILYCLVEHRHRVPRYGAALPGGLAAYAAFATYATSQQGGNAQWFSFHTLFLLCEFPCLYLVYDFFTGLDRREEALRSMMRRGFACYVSAIVLWLTDLNLCSTLQLLPLYSLWNLHAFGWHLLTSCGLYTMILGMMYHRLKCVLGVKVVLVNGAVPHLLPGPG